MKATFARSVVLSLAAGALLCAIALRPFATSSRASGEEAVAPPSFGADPIEGSAVSSAVAGSASVQARSSLSASAKRGANQGSELVLRGENWARYPGSLGDQVSRALEGADPEMAHFLGNRLADCVTYVAVPDVLLRRNMAAGLGMSAEDERMKSLCQSVAMDWQSASWNLLSLAVKGGQVGAASDMFRTAGRLSSEARVQLLADADRGHAWSVITLAAVAPAALGVSHDEQLLAKEALLLASEQVDATTRSRWTMAVQSVSARWGQSAAQSVRMPISADAKARAGAMATNLVERARSAS